MGDWGREPAGRDGVIAALVQAGRENNCWRVYPLCKGPVRWTRAGAGAWASGRMGLAWRGHPSWVEGTCEWEEGPVQLGWNLQTTGL